MLSATALRARIIIVLRQRRYGITTNWYSSQHFKFCRSLSTGGSDDNAQNSFLANTSMSRHDGIHHHSIPEPSHEKNNEKMTQLPDMEVLEQWAQHSEQCLNDTLKIVKAEGTLSSSSVLPDYIEKQYLAAIFAWAQCAKKFNPDVEISRDHADRAHQLLLQWHSDSKIYEQIPLPPFAAHERVVHGWRKGVSRKDPNVKVLTVDPCFVANRACEALEHYLQSVLLQEGDATAGQESAPDIALPAKLYFPVIHMCTKVTTKRQKASFLPKESLPRAKMFLRYSMHAAQLLDEMEVRRQEQQQFELDRITLKSYNLVLRALARTAKIANIDDNSSNGMFQQEIKNSRIVQKKQSQEALKVAIEAASEAWRLLDQLQELYGQEAAGFHTYFEFLKAWCHVSTPSGAKRARDILRRMEREPQVHMPNAFPYFMVLNAYAKIAHLVNFRATNRIAPAFDALEILNKMEQRLRSKKERLSSATESAPHPLSSNSDDQIGYASDDSDEEDEDAEVLEKKTTNECSKHWSAELPAPDAMCYGAVINAFAKSKIGEGKHKKFPAQFATEILNRMEKLYVEGKLADQPNLYCYGNTLTAWAHHEGDWAEGAGQAELVLERLENHFYRANDLEIAVQTGAIGFWYNIVLRRIADSKLEDGPLRVENILTRMEELYQDSISTNSAIVVDPDTRSYYAGIKAWARTGVIRDISRVDRARDILHRLIYMHKYKLSLRPSSDNCLPTTGCYNGVIIASAYTLGDENQQQALKVSREIFLELCESPYAKPNANTFGRMIQCVSRFERNDERRKEEIEEMFRMCCEAGEVNSYVLNTLKQGISEPFFEKLLASQKGLLPEDLTSPQEK